MKKTFFPFVVVLLFAISVVRAEDQASREYIIQKGDTLWDISDSELEDNFLWPKLWNVNPQIENPDRIYPGSSIIIPSREELMRMTIPPEKARIVKKRRKKAAAVVVPKIEKQKFLVDRNLYLASGWIDDTYPGQGEIVSTETGRTMVGQHEMVYINTQDNADIDTQYLVIREIKIVHHPESNDELGHQIRVSGIIKVVGDDDGQKKALVLESFENVHVGDGLIPFNEIELPPVTENPRTPDNSGYIVESHMNLKLLRPGNIIFLDKGKEDGLMIGDAFLIYTDTPVRRPIGNMQIISLRNTTAGAVITDSKNEITVGSTWAN
ncbi:MAG: LysM peptidoglycan-binding domain-containing protein [Nitrospiraceae bacterium]|nr:MAG: LysM peptidoglycan-binding domain-containing protein [Nitrospiraceae bacterium]